MRLILLSAAAMLVFAGAACQRPAEAPKEPTATGDATGSGGYTPPPLNTGAPKDGPATLALDGAIGPGAEVTVRWTGPANKDDYIDIVPRGNTRTSGEIAYVYVRDTAPTGAKLRAPAAAGDYDLRYIVQLDSERKIAATAPLTLAAATASLQGPADAMGGAKIQVTWTGPNGEGDYIDIVPASYGQTSGEISYAYTRDGSPATITAPGPTGAYEIRYVLEGPGGRQVLARAPLGVTVPVATLEAQASAKRGELVSITWTGPSNEGDYVDIVPKGYGATSGELAYFYTRDGSPRELNAPANKGDYEIRYVMEAPKGRLILARAPLTVE